MRGPLGLMLAFTVMLAGCTDDTPEPQAASTTTGDLTSNPPATNTTAPAPPVLETMALSASGNLGTFAGACEFVATNTCQFHEVTPGASDFYLHHTGGNLTSLTVNVTWTATSPATQTLGVRAMVMADPFCQVDSGCTLFAPLEGASPLQYRVDNLLVPLNETWFIHIFAYNPQGLVSADSVPAFGYASVDQAFEIEGTATVLTQPRS